MGLFHTKGQTLTPLDVIQVSLTKKKKNLYSVKDIITLKLQSKCYQLLDA